MLIDKDLDYVGKFVNVVAGDDAKSEEVILTENAVFISAVFEGALVIEPRFEVDCLGIEGGGRPRGQLPLGRHGGEGCG